MKLKIIQRNGAYIPPLVKTNFIVVNNIQFGGVHVNGVHFDGVLFDGGNFDGVHFSVKIDEVIIRCSISLFIVTSKAHAKFLFHQLYSEDVSSEYDLTSSKVTGLHSLLQSSC